MVLFVSSFRIIGPFPSSAGFGRPCISEFGRIRAVVPFPSSAGFGRTGGFGQIRASTVWESRATDLDLDLHLPVLKNSYRGPFNINIV